MVMPTHDYRKIKFIAGPFIVAILVMENQVGRYKISKVLAKG